MIKNRRFSHFLFIFTLLRTENFDRITFTILTDVIDNFLIALSTFNIVAFMLKLQRFLQNVHKSTIHFSCFKFFTASFAFFVFFEFLLNTYVTVDIFALFAFLDRCHGNFAAANAFKKVGPSVFFNEVFFQLLLKLNLSYDASRSGKLRWIDGSGVLL